MSWQRNRSGLECPRCGRGRKGEKAGKCRWQRSDAPGYLFVQCVEDPAPDDERRGVRFVGATQRMIGGKYLVPIDGCAPSLRGARPASTHAATPPKLSGQDATRSLGHILWAYQQHAKQWADVPRPFIESKGARYYADEYVALPQASERGAVRRELEQLFRPGAPLESLAGRKSQIFKAATAFDPHARLLELHRGPDGRARSARVSLVDHPDGEKARSLVGFDHRAHYAHGWEQRVLESGVLVITEGARGANEVQWRTGYGAVGHVSIYSTEGDDLTELRAIIERLGNGRGLREVHLAPDYGDIRDGEPRHDNARRAILRWSLLRDVCEANGITMRGIAWSDGLGKGADDVLANLMHTSGGYPDSVFACELDGWIESFVWSPKTPIFERRKNEKETREDARALLTPPLSFFSEDTRPFTLDVARESIRDDLRAAMDDAITEGPNEIQFAIHPPGTGKTTAIVSLVREAHEDPTAPPIALFVNAAVIDEMEEKLRQQGVPVYRRVGLQAPQEKGGCAFAELFQSAGRLSATRGCCATCEIPNERRHAAAQGLTSAGDCFAKRLSPSDIKDLSDKRTVLLADVASYESLAGNDGDTNALAGRLAIFDDCAAPTTSSEPFTVSALSSITRAHRGGSRKWLRLHSHAEAIADAALALRDRAGVLLRERASDSNLDEKAARAAGRHGVDLDPEESRLFLISGTRDRDGKDCRSAFRAVARIGAQVDEKGERQHDPRPAPHAIRDGHADGNPLTDAELEAIRAIASATDFENGTPVDGVVTIHITPDGTPLLTVTRPKPLGVHGEVGVLVLDSSAHALQRLFQAANPKKVLRFHGAPVAAPDGVEAIHFVKSGFHRAGLCPHGALTDGGTEKIASALEEIREQASEKLGMPAGALELGIIADKPVANDLRAGLDASPGAPRIINPVHWSLGDSEEAQRIIHRGRGDRASNALEDVDVLAILGRGLRAPRAYSQEAAALGLPFDEVQKVRTEEALWQAIGRLRPLQRTTRALVALVHEGETPTAVKAWGLPVTPVESKAREGQVRKEEATDFLRQIVGEITRRVGAVSVPLIEAVWRFTSTATLAESVEVADRRRSAESALTGSGERTKPLTFYRGASSVTSEQPPKPPHKDTIRKRLAAIADDPNDDLLDRTVVVPVQLHRSKTGTITQTLKVQVVSGGSGTDAELGQRVADLTQAVKERGLDALLELEPVATESTPLPAPVAVEPRSAAARDLDELLAPSVREDRDEAGQSGTLRDIASSGPTGLPRESAGTPGKGREPLSSLDGSNSSDSPISEDYRGHAVTNDERGEELRTPAGVTLRSHDTTPAEAPEAHTPQGRLREPVLARGPAGALGPRDVSAGGTGVGSAGAGGWPTQVEGEHAPNPLPALSWDQIDDLFEANGESGEGRQPVPVETRKRSGTERSDWSQEQAAQVIARVTQQYAELGPSSPINGGGFDPFSMPVFTSPLPPRPLTSEEPLREVAQKHSWRDGPHEHQAAIPGSAERRSGGHSRKYYWLVDATARVLSKSDPRKGFQVRLSSLVRPTTLDESPPSLERVFERRRLALIAFMDGLEQAIEGQRAERYAWLGTEAFADLDAPETLEEALAIVRRMVVDDACFAWLADLLSFDWKARRPNRTLWSEVGRGCADAVGWRKLDANESEAVG